jgi:hypothetical protein
MGVIVVSGNEEGGEVRQFIWNGAAGRVLGQGLGVKTAFSPSVSCEEEGAVGSRVELTWNGRIIKPKKNIPGEI